jgi:hypothetical protein
MLQPLIVLMSAWAGHPTTIPPDGLRMLPSPNGPVILGFFNQDATPNDGQVTVTSGASFIQDFPVPAQQAAPVLFVRDFQGNNLNVSNTSTGGSKPPILAEAWAPGLQPSGELPADGEPYPLPVYMSRTAVSLPQMMQLTLRSGNGEYTVFGVYIGNEVTIYCVNAPGGGSPGCDRSTPDNFLVLRGNWNGATLYVVNLSAASQTGATVTLQEL